MKKITILYIIFLIALPGQTSTGNFLKSLQEWSVADKLFTTAIDEKRNQLKALRAERQDIAEKMRSFASRMQTTLHDLATQVGSARALLKRDPRQQEFLNSKLGMYDERYRKLKEEQAAYKELIALVDEHIEVLEECLKNPDQKDATQVQETLRPIYPFSELQSVERKVAAQTERVKYLDEQLANVKTELDSRSKNAQTLQQTYEKKQAELKEVLDLSDAKAAANTLTTEAQQKVALAELQERFAFEKNELAQLQLLVTQHRMQLLTTKDFVAKLRLDVLKDSFKMIKAGVRVHTEDIAAARAQLNKRQQQSFAIKEGYHQEVEALVKNNAQRAEELKRLGKQYGVAQDGKLDEWAVEANQSAASYLAVCVLSNLNSQFLLVERQKEFFEAQMNFEDEKLRFDRMQIDIKGSFQKIKEKRFTSEEEITKEIKEYDAPLAEINATISRFKEKENVVTGLIAAQKHARDNVQALLENLQKKRETIFKRFSKEFNQCVFLVREAQLRVQQQIEVMEKTVGVYRDSVAKLQDNKDQISFIVSELQAVSGIWLRSEHAIKMEALKNIVPDLKRFRDDMLLYFVSFSPAGLFEGMRGIAHGFMFFLWMVLKLLLVVLFLVAFKRGIVFWLYKLCDLFEKRNFKGFSFLGRVALDFVLVHYKSLSLWFMALALLCFGFPSQLHALTYGIFVIFYLAAIPFFLYLARKFFDYYLVMNARTGYEYLSHQYQSRFMLIVSTLTYSTIVLQFLRKALIIATYPQPDFAEILLALNFIILQVALIFLITREQVLSLIPTQTELWRKVYYQVNRFYYLLLFLVVVAIVMMNPYVGLGRLVSHVILRLVLSVCLVPLVLWLYELLKKSMSKLFFTTDEEVLKERFTSAKSWYGLAIIAAIVGMVLVSALIGAFIWGWSITYSSIIGLLGTKIFAGEGGAPISIISFLKLFGFIVLGLVVSYALVRFVIQKIFDLLLFEMGVQHAIIGITRYFVIISFCLIGLKHVGLGPLIMWLLGLALAIGYVVKEPISDFIAYFILLIQRPLKIGDYIQMDAETYGVVRKITSRSIMVRMKNSTTVVIPNSLIFTKTITNWNYSSNYVALDDILLNISYKENPEKVIQVITAAVESHPNILRSPKPVIRLESFGEYSFVFLIRPFVSSHYTLDIWDIASDVRRAIIRELRANAIEMALPIYLYGSLRDVKKMTGVIPDKNNDNKDKQNDTDKTPEDLIHGQ
jgi:small-conductance mechanosensitive channel